VVPDIFYSEIGGGELTFHLSGTISINDGPEYTASRAVTLNLSAAETGGEQDRSAGVMVRPVGGMPAGLAEGKLVDVGGAMKTGTNRERWLEASVSVRT